MTTITELCPVIQSLLTETATRLAYETGFVRRKRQISGAGFAQSTVLGWLNCPDATRNQLHHAAIQTGMEVSRQGLDKRFTQEAVVFMRRLVEEAVKIILRSEDPKGCFSSFQAVYLTDCSQTRVGDKREKLAARLELKHGQLQITLEEARTHDQRARVMEQVMNAGDLHIGDLGFFSLKRFQTWNEAGVYWLSRFKIGTWLYDAAGQPLDLLAALNQQLSDRVSFPVQMGKRDRVCAYLVAQRVSDAVYQQRQEQFKELRRRQHPVSILKEMLAHWTIYLTSIPHLTFEQAHILARSRWQIELIFKLWKSHARLTHSRSTNPLRQQCEFYAKLLAVLIAHWIFLVTGWQHLRLSAVQALRIIRPHAFRLLRAISSVRRLNLILHDIQHDLARVGHRSSRRKAPSAFQLWHLFDALTP
ncbi:MAG: IS4 family transposase [Anaerolineae bacterium]|nr:IS4 family transposase [Anaerolineae bacterium]